jgi:WD40 repeat protein
VLRVAFAPDGKTFVAGQFDRHAQVYDAERLAPVGEPWKHGAAVLAVAVSPDGRLVATGCDDQDLAIRLHDAATGRVVRTLTGHTRKVVSLEFSPDGKRLVSGSWDRTARLWDVATGEPVGQPLQHLDLVQAVAFSPDGSLILTGADDYMTRLWNADALQLRGAALRHPEKVQAVAFSPDGLLFATGDKAGHVGLWETRTSKRLGVGARHGGEVHSLAFTPDGKMLLSGGWDGLVHRLRVPTEVWLEPLALRRWLERHTSQTLIEPGVITPLSLGAWEQRALDPTSK